MFRAVIVAGVIGTGCNADRNVDLSLVIRGDALETLAGARLSCSEGMQTWNVTCDERGQSPAITVADDSIIDVMVLEQEVGSLRNLGQRRSVSPSAFAISHGSATLHWMQPTLRPIMLKPDREHYVEGIADRWVITTAPSATDYSHPVEVALLASAEQLEALAAYHGVAFNNLGDAFGCLFRSDLLQLPDDGLWLSISIPSRANGHALRADWTLLASTEADSHSGDLSIALRGIDEQKVILWLSGTFGKGDNLLILRPGTAGNSQGPLRLVKDQHTWTPSVLATHVQCTPVAARPPPGWCAQPLQNREALITEAQEQISLRASRVNTFQTGGIVCREVDTQASGESIVVYDGWIAPFLRCGTVGETDADLRMQLWGDEVSWSYSFDIRQRCFVEYRHEALLVQAWQVRRPRIVPGLSGAYSVIAQGSTRTVQSLSMQLWGASVTSCGSLAR